MSLFAELKRRKVIRVAVVYAATAFAALREDPRFFAFAEDYGLVRLWETRGYPPGCRRVNAPGGDHLDCAGIRR